MWRAPLQAHKEAGLKQTKAEPVSSWERAESAFQAALADFENEDSIRGRVIENARARTHGPIILLTDQEFTAAEIEHSYPVLESKGMNT
jgi:hypothetical protein